MGVYEFIKKYYIDSMVYKQGYNPVNTITFAIILIVSAYLIYRYLSKRVKFDLKFALYTFPYILFGSSLRVVEDSGFVDPPFSYFLMTPFIYIIVFLITFTSLLVSLRTEYRYYPIPGIILSSGVLIFLFKNLEIENWWVLPASISISLTIVFIYHLLSEKVKADSFSKITLFGQLIDGSTSFLGIQYLDYWELHVLPRFFINMAGPWIMIPLKLFVIVPLLYLIDSENEDDSLLGFIKFVIFTLGFAPGIRNGLRMTFGV